MAPHGYHGRVGALPPGGAASPEMPPDLQFHFQPMSTTGTPAVYLDDFDAFTASVCILRSLVGGFRLGGEGWFVGFTEVQNLHHDAPELFGWLVGLR